jgi:hypothetical protein
MKMPRDAGGEELAERSRAFITAVREARGD